METKLKIGKERTLMQEFSEEWSIITNTEKDDPNSCDSIWHGSKRYQWSLQPIIIHRQLIHAKLINMGGYEFHFTIVFGLNIVLECTLLWDQITSLKSIYGHMKWLLIGDL